MISPSSAGPPPNPLPLVTSSVFTTITSTFLGGQTTAITKISTTIISAPLPTGNSPLPVPSGSTTISSPSSSIPTQSGGFQISLPNPSNGPGSVTLSTISASTVGTMTSLTTKTEMVTTTSTMMKAPSISSSNTATPSLPAVSSTSKTSFLWPISSSSSQPLPSVSSLLSSTSPMMPSQTSSASLSSRSSSSNSIIFGSTTTRLPFSPSNSSPITRSSPTTIPSSALSASSQGSLLSTSLVLSSPTSTPRSLTSSSSLEPSASVTIPNPTSLSSSPLNSPITSTVVLTPTLSFRSSIGTAPSPPNASPFSTLTSLLNISSSSSWLSSSSSVSSSMGNSSSSVLSSWSSSSLVSGFMSIQTDTTAWLTRRSSSTPAITTGVPVSSFLSVNASSSLMTSLESGSLSIQTKTTIGGTTAASSGLASLSRALEGRGLATKFIRFGGAGFKFIFPSPDITTTVSYWTGAYPTITGPLPSELQTIIPTTRSIRQTPISAPPSYESFPSRSQPGGFKTVVQTIYEDDENLGSRNVKRFPAAQIMPTPTTTATTAEEALPTTATMSIMEPPSPISCGESGNFTLNFDDTTSGPADEQSVSVNGFKNPYHHLFYANGYTDVPDKWEPYPAISQPNVAMYLPLTGRLGPSQPFAGLLLPGELGAGPRASSNAYWFNAYSGYFGCALNGITPCTLRISGYRYDATMKEEVLVAEQNATLPACWGYIGCRLNQVVFNEGFRGLSGIQINAFTGGLGIPQAHMMDDLVMGWYNNSCSAGIMRIGHR
ncbi:hypothetical protein GQ44DRAFT_707275 [Phaeosphaeriaceae sp. PMI808]|nr:hypothetical protein GQ44DRAFT_707275 [Phaeosphaeriaceae sp. PMI808]